MQGQSNLLLKGLQWWWSGLRACLPEHQASKTGDRRHIRCMLNDDQLELALITAAGVCKDHLTVDLDNQQMAAKQLRRWLKSRRRYPVALLLPAGSGLVCDLKLPATAANDLDAIMAFEIERQTPFQADHVHTGYHIEKTDHGVALMVKMAVVPIKLVAPMLRQLSGLGLDVNTLQLALDPGTQRNAGGVIEIPLAPVDISATVARSGRSGLNSWLLVLLATLLLSLLYQPARQYEAATEDLAQATEIVRKQALVAKKLQLRNSVTSQRVRFLGSRLNHRLRLNVMEALARLLPDNTWLTDLEVQDDRIVLRGVTSAAADLIALLSASGVFSDVRFSAPIMHDGDTGLDRFSLTAKITPAGVLADV